MTALELAPQTIKPPSTISSTLEGFVREVEHLALQSLLRTGYPLPPNAQAAETLAIALDEGHIELGDYGKDTINMERNLIAISLLGNRTLMEVIDTVR